MDQNSDDNQISEIEETDPRSDASTPLLGGPKKKVPEVDVHLYRQGKGPIDSFKSSLGGYEQNQLEVRDILDKYGFKSLYAFNPGSGRGVPIRFNPRNGRSILPYRDGAEIHVDGEPADSLIKPVTRILIGVAVMTILITFVMKDPPEFIQKFNFFGGNFPPWILALVVIVFTRMSKRTRDFMKRYGW